MYWDVNRTVNHSVGITIVLFIYIQLIMDYGSRTADKCPTGKRIVLLLLLYYIYSIYAFIMEHVKIRISV
jgi:hypothetical protein